MNEKRKMKTSLHHSCIDMNELRYAKETAWNNLLDLSEGKTVMNKWYSAKLTPVDIMESAARSIESLVIIIERLTKNRERCKKCGGIGYYSERMGGCRDENENVICSACNGRF